MMDLSHTISRLVLILLSSTIGACVVTPKKGASYDEKCMVSAQKIVLTTEQMRTFDEIGCLTRSCKEEVTGALVVATLTATTSAIVSGSVALIGNTLYWLESQGECPNKNHQKEDKLQVLPGGTDETYLIREEVITARS